MTKIYPISLGYSMGNIYLAPGPVSMVFDSTSQGVLVEVDWEALEGDPCSFKLKHMPFNQIYAMVLEA